MLPSRGHLQTIAVIDKRLCTRNILISVSRISYWAFLTLKLAFRTPIFMIILTTFLRNTIFRSIMIKILWISSVFLFLIGYFVVLFTIDRDQKDIVVVRFLKAHLLNGFIETIPDLFWLSSDSLGAFIKTRKFLAVFWNLVMFQIWILAKNW